jgi:uncharacterized phage infection (PIP) family protein YhgE
MTSAISGLLGNSNILQMAMTVMFPEAAIAGAVANIGSQIIGDVVKQAASQLCQESGMPKFVQDIVKQVVDQVLNQCKQPTEPGCESKCKDGGRGDWMQNFIDNLAKQLTEAVKDGMDKDGKCEGGKGGHGHKATGGSWLVALARALGEVAGDKAAKMVELANKLETLNDESQGLEKGSKAEEANAKESTATQNELNGVSKEFQQFMEMINNVVKGIGDGLTSVARK